MSNTSSRIFFSSAQIDSVFVDGVGADAHQRGRWFSRVWNGLCFLWQEALHA
ncbi:MAG TPA: hypothetical protein VJ761_26095 [Ktedonobacteraceae bacterium]|nr:hypothetical protein [Ktedonobacteraceae bacterium]